MKKWLTLPLVAALATLAVLTLLVWLGVEDGRRAALLDARIRDAEERHELARERFYQLARDGRPPEEIMQTEEFMQVSEEDKGACEELDTLRPEWLRRQRSWHARLLAEIRRRAGW